MASAAGGGGMLAELGELKLAPLGGKMGTAPKRSTSDDHVVGPAPLAAASTNTDEPHELNAAGASDSDMVSLMDTPEKLLVIDARPYSDYVVGHISGSLSVRLSSLMTRRLVRGKLKLFDLIVNEQKDRFNALYAQEECCIIVYDSKTPDDGIGTYSSKNPLHVILRALDAEKRVGCRFLLGGFESFKAANPDKVFVPEVVVNQGLASLNFDEPLSATIVTAGGPAGGISGLDSPAPGSHAKRILNILPSEILGHVFIGSRRDAANKDLLSNLGITHVLNVTHDCPCHHESTFIYHRIPVKDTWNQDLPSFFSAAFDFINKAKGSNPNAKVLIHCTAGISRSSTLTIAYVMNEQRLSLHQAYTFVKTRRDVIAPNLDFMGELQQFEKSLNITPTSPTAVAADILADRYSSLPNTPSNAAARLQLDQFDDVPTPLASTPNTSPRQRGSSLATSSTGGSALVTEVSVWPPPALDHELEAPATPFLNAVASGLPQ